MKIRPETAELFRTDRRMDMRIDGQTDMTKLIVAFLTFAIAPKNNPWDSCLNADCTNTDSVSYCTTYLAPQNTHNIQGSFKTYG